MALVEQPLAHWADSLISLPAAMPKPLLTPTTLRDQERLIEAGQQTEDLGTAAMLVVFGAMVIGFVGLVVYALSGFFR